MSPLHFLKTAIKDYRVGALTASSRFVVDRLCRELGDAKFVIEYGAGNGVVTKGILRALPSDGQCVAIERNETFVRELRSINDSRLSVLATDVQSILCDPSLLPFSCPDTVVSGIPLTLFSPKQREEVIQKTAALLSPNGTFLVYQYSFLVLPVLKKYFSSVELLFEPRNIPPYFIMVAQK